MRRSNDAGHAWSGPPAASNTPRAAQPTFALSATVTPQQRQRSREVSHTSADD